MKKLYTYDNKRITVCNDFELKFKSFLSFIKKDDEKIYLLLINSSDFNINREVLLEKFQGFFENWLKDHFALNQPLSINSLEIIFNEIKMTDNRYEEFFSYYNFYKKLFDSKDMNLFFYDSQSKTPHGHFKKYLNEL
ncbi:hypothetical protein [Chryseobacterium sp. MA9]|uniref:hypothetical protein n=1 Tax=Chryseobacterium sp. MA9 TaxID=2966625 RepID=UPI002103A800|nr:hypothetical protein [Chryseobacterium sp. MA9]UTX48818.1 hypothetical protein KIK00_00685 [Chryseobacterium sp. MA9]